MTHYLELCQALGKKAHFVYDLDSLFRGRLRSCIGDDNSIRSLLAFAGVGAASQRMSVSWTGCSRI